MSPESLASALGAVLGIGLLLLMLASFATMPRHLRGLPLALRMAEVAGLAAGGIGFLAMGAALAAL